MDEHGHEDVYLRITEQLGRLGDVARDRLLREDAVELALQRFGGALDVLARDGIENLETSLLHDSLQDIDDDRCDLATAYRCQSICGGATDRDDRGILSASSRGADRTCPGRATRRRTQGPGRSSATPPLEPDPGTAGRRGLRLPSDRAARVEPANR